MASRLATLDDLPPDEFVGNAIPAIQRGMIRIMVGGVVQSHSYDPRIPTADFDRLLSKGKVEEFPFHVYGIRRHRLTGQRLEAVADAGTNRIAVVPLLASPIDECLQPPDSDIECPVDSQPAPKLLHILTGLSSTRD